MIKMRKLFFKISMLLFVLGMSTNAAWANFDANPYYVAQMTASVSSTGGGKVYLDAGQNKDEGGQPIENYVPGDEEYVTSVTRTRGLALSMQGMSRMKVAFTAWQKADDGYYFAGWSYADNGFDLGMRKPTDAEVDIFSDLYDVGTEKSTYRLSDPENESSDPVRDDDGNVIYEEGEYFPAVYTLFATFEPIRISGYRLSGSNTTVENEGKKECTQTVTFTFSGEDIDVDDFNNPAIVPADAKWKVNNDFAVDGTAKTGNVTVTFSTNEANHTTSSANLRLTTKAGVSINITLDARTATASGKDLALYDGKTYKADIDFDDPNFASQVAACAKPIIKLNKNYNSALTIDKNLTLDLCGYTIAGLTVNAENEATLLFSPYGGTISGAVTNNGTLTLAGGTLAGALTNNGTLYQNGATINGAVTNNGTMTTTDGVHAQTVTTTSGSVLTVNGGQFVPASGVAIDVKANATAVIKKGTIEGKTYGVQSAGSTTIEKLATISGSTKALKQTAGTLTVNCGKFLNPNTLKEGTIVFNSGYFKEDGGQSVIEGKPIWRNTTGAEFRENYLFFAGDANTAKAAGVSVCHIGGTSYSALEDALAYANTTSDKVIIIMDNDYILPAGYYTLPANAVLIVPKSNEQGNETKTVERAIYSETPGYEVRYVAPTKFRCLTLSEGVNLDVHGTIEVSGTQYSSHEAYTSAVYGPYGQLQLNKGSKITLQDGSELRAWGYVTGDIASQDAEHHVPMGEIDARRGSTVREQFQMGDWKGAAFSGMGLLQGNPVFPLNTYFIQNIEAPVKYHPGAVLSTAAGVTAAEGEWGSYGNAVKGVLGTANISMSANDIKVIGVTEGEPAMFLMDAAADAENTWVRKWYDASKDQQVYEINSGAHIGNLIIPLVSSPFFSEFSLGGNKMPEDLTMNSGQYFLPITNNFKLHLLSGIMDFTQSTELLPGAEVEIDKESRVYITPTDGVNSGALFVYDAEDWGNYAGGVPTRLVKYAPSFDGEPITRGELRDATVLVHGTFEISEDGYVYTSEKGANITSTNEDAGTFAFFADNTTETKTVSQVSGATGGGQVDQTFYPAKLRNGDNSFAETSGKKNLQTMMYLDNKWIGDEQLMIYLDCFTAEADYQKYLLAMAGKGSFEDAVEKIYIKPQEYVEIAYTSLTVTVNAGNPSVTVEGNPNHTYSDAAGAGRLFIQVGDNLTCQWWEVEAKDNYYHCIHPENDTYYEWDGSKWVEKKFTITWKDWDGTTITTYSVPYGTQAEWLSTNPTRGKSGDYTYDFTGWSPALGKVTSDVTYMATYEEKQIKYTIVFVNDGGTEIERHLLARDEVPVCENVPTRTGYILQWSPNDPAPVTGDQTYTATWLPEPPETYTITFKNYNGTQLDQQQVTAGEKPEYAGATPTKTETNEYEYSFSGWKPAVVAANSNATYVAQFTEEPKQYTINFYREDGTTLIETQYIPYGGEPVIPAYTKANTAQYTYSIAWKNKANNANIQSVTGNADYKAVVTATTNKYNVKLVSNPSGACVLVGNGIYEYDEAENAVTISVTNIAANHTFTGWSDGNTDVSRTMAITGDINLVANFSVSDPDYKINWWNEAGTEQLVPEVGQKANTNTLYPGVIPTKDATAQYTYTFDGWATTAGGERAYKNNMTPKATADADYYAHFEATVNNYEVTLTASPASAATFSGLGVYPYNENADAVTLTVIPNAGYTFTGWSDGQAGTNLTRQMAITDNIHLVANFDVNVPDYTITWKSEDGEQILATVGHKYKTQSTYKGELPSKASTAEYGYTFDGWTSEKNGAGTYYANGSTPKVVANATYYAHFNRETIGVEVAEDKTIDQDLEVATTTVYVEGTLNVASGNTLTTDNLIIEADPEHSGQITGVGTVVADNVYFDLTRGAGNVFKHHTWYAFSVPFTVDASQILFDGETMQYGQTEKQDDYDVLYYAGSVRASLGKDASCWKYVEKATPTYLYPGTLYMIANTKRDVTKLRFTKATGALLTTSVSVAAYDSENGADANWNGIANPALFHADLSGVGAAENIAWVYNPDYSDPTNAYVKINDLSARELILGEAIFVQTATGTTINVTPTTPSPVVRRRVQANDSQNARYQVMIAKADGNATDDVIVRTDEDKEEDAYVLGRDLVRMGMSSINPQLWINRYDEKLCVNVVKPINNEANYPLGIFAPADGEYSIFTEAEPNEHTALYLTFDGQAIWNLSDGEYVATFEKGTNNRYGLRISAKAPQVTTGVDEAIVDAQGETRKVLINNQVFIIRGNNVYSIDGQIVK